MEILGQFFFFVFRFTIRPSIYGCFFQCGQAEINLTRNRVKKERKKSMIEKEILWFMLMMMIMIKLMTDKIISDSYEKKAKILYLLLLLPLLSTKWLMILTSQFKFQQILESKIARKL